MKRMALQTILVPPMMMRAREAGEWDRTSWLDKQESSTSALAFVNLAYNETVTRAHQRTSTAPR